MTKKLQVHLEDELFDELKIYSIRTKRPVKDLVAEAIANIIGQATPEPAPKTQPKKKETPKPTGTYTQPAPKRYPADDFYGTPEPDYSKTLDELLNEEPDPTDERYYYVLRKTFMTTLYEDEDKWYDNGVLHWLVPKDCQAHYDRDNNLIPFRYTMPDSYTIKQPTAAEIKEIEKAYGKPVKIEE